MKTLHVGACCMDHDALRARINETCLPQVTFGLALFQYHVLFIDLQVVKPSERWSTYIKIDLNQRFLDLRNRFHIGDNGGFKKKS